MKKVLISILIVLLVVLAYFAIFNGLSFGNVNILSVEQIVQANDELTDNIAQAKALLEKDYLSEKEGLSASITDLLNKKEAYFKLAKISTDTEISKANTEETYVREYLWTRIGNHATSRGTNIRIDVTAGDAGDESVKNLSITAKGYYFGIMDFISALENDDKLNFQIENFRMVQDEELLSATFIVRGVRIKTETLSSSTVSSSQQDTNDDNSDKQNTTNDKTQNDGSKLNQLTGAVDNVLAPAENTQQ